jgi:hypothetical protein
MRLLDGRAAVANAKTGPAESGDSINEQFGLIRQLLIAHP